MSHLILSTPNIPWYSNFPGWVHTLHYTLHPVHPVLCGCLCVSASNICSGCSGSPAHLPTISLGNEKKVREFEQWTVASYQYMHVVRLCEREYCEKCWGDKSFMWWWWCEWTFVTKLGDARFSTTAGWARAIDHEGANVTGNSRESPSHSTKLPTTDLNPR